MSRRLVQVGGPSESCQGRYIPRTRNPVATSTVPVPSQLQTESRTNEGFPEMTPAQLARIEQHGRRRRLAQGEVVGEPGQPVTKIFVVLSGQLDAVHPPPTHTRALP